MTFLESDKRRELFEKRPPQTVYVAANRLLCGINGDFTAKDKNGNTVYDKNGVPKRMSSAKAYAWFVWIKDKYTTTQIKWFN